MNAVNVAADITEGAAEVEEKEDQHKYSHSKASVQVADQVDEEEQELVMLVEALVVHWME